MRELLFECAPEHPAQIGLACGLKAWNRDRLDGLYTDTKSIGDLDCPAQREEIVVAERAPIWRIIAHSSHRAFALEDERWCGTTIELGGWALVHEPSNAIDDDFSFLPLRFTKGAPQFWVLGHGRLT